MKKKPCTIIDYGIGNVFSVQHALNSLGANTILTRDSATIRDADRVILPGVGAFGRASNRLTELGLDENIKTFVQSGRPFLGICVGMQLLMTSGSEFGTHNGLDLIRGTVDKVDSANATGGLNKVPLIGWNSLVSGPNANHFDEPIFAGIPRDAAFYFVHSYSCQPSDPDTILAQVDNGSQNIVAAVQQDNIVGVQFHPERSSSDGLKFLDNFLSL